MSSNCASQTWDEYSRLLAYEQNTCMLKTAENCNYNDNVNLLKNIIIGKMRRGFRNIIIVQSSQGVGDGTPPTIMHAWVGERSKYCFLYFLKYKFTAHKGEYTWLHRKELSLPENTYGFLGRSVQDAWTVEKPDLDIEAWQYVRRRRFLSAYPTFLVRMYNIQLPLSPIIIFAEFYPRRHFFSKWEFM